jgi:hypothetical protein
VSRNSDLKAYFDEKKDEYNWKKEYLKVRFTKEYMVYKVRSAWPVFDILSHLMFIIVNTCIMLLATYWYINAIMFFLLVCFSIMCLSIA